MRCAFALIGGAVRYFFHVIGGQGLPDLVGTELDSYQQAKTEAVKLAGELMARAPDAFGDGHEWRVEITDDRQLLLFYLRIVLATVVDSPDEPRIKAVR